MDHPRLTAETARGAVWVTRAQPGAASTAAAVAALGFAPLVEPLLELAPLRVAPPDLDGVAALAFTSAAGVRIFAALHPDRSLPVFAVGDATAQAARALGWSRVRSAGGDVAALDALLAAEAPPGRVLAPGALRPAGNLHHAERLAVYDTKAAPGPWPLADAALARGRLRAVLVHSPSAGRALAASARADALATVLALSPACAAAIDPALWAAVRVAERPDARALLALLTAGCDPPAPWQPPPAPL
ncbi:MAG: uroporphyrinogen-III synthase [Caulobacteraceae bacterium]|nr:uroporphyrinogen-III synthase [Caulobacter sp.]